MLKFWGVAIGFMLFLWFFSPDEPEQEQEFAAKTSNFSTVDGKLTPTQGVDITPPEQNVKPFRYQTGKVPISTKRGKLTLTLGFAHNSAQHAMGLMHYRVWPRNMHGLLFLFKKEDTYSIWMHNTHIPLDVLFIDRSGYITQIATNTVPMSKTPVKAIEPVLALLEIPAGSAKKWGLKKGDRFRLKYFRSALNQ